MNFTNPKSVITTPLQIIGELVHFVKSNTVDYYKTTSLSEVTKLTRVEPITVVSRDCMNLDYTGQILQTVLNVFAGYYLQAVALTARVGGVKVTKILDKLNPDRDSSGFFASLESMSSPKVLLASEYQYKLPRVAMEGKLKDLLEGKDLDVDQDSEAEQKHGTVEIDKGIGGRGVLAESSNLAVGKMLVVDIQIDDQEIQIPVSVRLASSVLPDTSVEHILTLKKEDNTLVERWHAWRAGRIAFMRDLVLAQDLIDMHKKALMHDDQGTYSEIIRRANNTKKYGLLTQNPSVVSASSIFVFSEEIAKNVERQLGGKLDNPRVRQKAFDNTYAMILVVVDREWERVTIYTRGVSAPTELSIKEIKAAGNGKGPDVGDILKSLMQGAPVSF